MALGGSTLTQDLKQGHEATIPRRGPPFFRGAFAPVHDDGRHAAGQKIVTGGFISTKTRLAARAVIVHDV